MARCRLCDGWVAGRILRWETELVSGLYFGVDFWLVVAGGMPVGAGAGIQGG